MLADNGYQKLKNGLIIQWGHFDTSIYSSNFDVNFPQPFPHSCFSLAFNDAGHSGGDGHIIRTSAITPIGFKCEWDLWNDVGFGWPISVFYIAIGY